MARPAATELAAEATGEIHHLQPETPVGVVKGGLRLHHGLERRVHGAQLVAHRRVDREMVAHEDNLELQRGLRGVW